MEGMVCSKCRLALFDLSVIRLHYLIALADGIDRLTWSGWWGHVIAELFDSIKLGTMCALSAVETRSAISQHLAVV